MALSHDFALQVELYSEQSGIETESVTYRNFTFFGSCLWTVMASFLHVLELFFCFIVSSHALYENISYNDIMLNMAKLQRIGAQKDLGKIRPPFDDTVLHMISAPWKLLQDGSKIARKLNNGMSISADCDTGIKDTVTALIKREGWAGSSKCLNLN